MSRGHRFGSQEGAFSTAEWLTTTRGAHEKAFVIERRGPIYDRRLMTRPIFSLDDARALLPRVRQLTAEAVIRAEALAEELRRVPEQDPEHAQLSTALQDIVNDWANEVRALGVDVKGLWLVDFDNGEGYYCWKYPEDTIGHYHGYEEGFAGRISIQ